MNKDLKLLEWLIGEWEGIQGQGVYHEEWEKINDNELKGKAYIIKKGEIINREILKLHSNGFGIYYTAEVSHNPKPVSFKLTNLKDTTAIFENPRHDFPQKIIYENKIDALLATIEGTKNNKFRKVELNLRKLN